MIVSLAPLFDGPLAAYEDKLRLASDPAHTLAGSQLFQPDYFTEFIGNLQPAMAPTICRQ